GNPHLDEIIIFDEEDIHKSPFAKIKFIRQLKAKKFNTAFLFHRSFTRALITFLAGIPERVGYATAKRGILLTKRITPPKKDSTHRIDHYMGVLEEAGLKIEDRYTEFFVDEKDEKFIAGFLKSEKLHSSDFIVGINPGGNWGPKRWPKEYFAELSDLLITELKAKVVILGGEKDAALAQEIKGWMKEKPVIATGKFSLKQLAAFLKKVDLFISADTGPLHIANAVGTKNIIALFGPTSVNITGPYPLTRVVLLQKNTGCVIPCYEVDCKDNRCMKAITPEDVLEKAKAIKNAG
ncbi:MAG: lipopolysaccharide heptosyltransferase II, partial [Candidatus Omnitrophica bacterium]|nr:lipopolysaccharide heptosyltransferase II [Candidatus Omnitrophota bacterium]